jgi:hypothetical protein
MDIPRAVGPGERYSTVPFVRPGGESLRRLAGWPKVEKVRFLCGNECRFITGAMLRASGAAYVAIA